MKFVYPEFFYALFLLLIPVLIHLFNFRKYKVLYFSSLLFVKQIDEESKSTRKLKHLLVLFSRILAFTCLIAAFAQPYLPLSEKEQGGYPLLAIYVDNSFSMAQKGAEGELLSMAKEQARKFINQADPSSKIMLVSNNFESFEQHLSSKENALDQLDNLDFSPLNKSSDEVVQWMIEGIHQEEKKTGVKLASKQFILLSDFQKKSTHFSKLQPDEDNFYYPIQLLPQNTGNVSIDSIWFSDPNFKIGVKNELFFKVVNYSDKDFVNLELQIVINETKRDVFVDVQANSSLTSSINYSDQQGGIKTGVVKINDKQMSFDDEFYFSYVVEEKASILIVNGEDAASSIGLVYSLDPYYAIEQISSSAFTNSSLDEKDLLVINGWNQFSTGASASIYNFVKEGGAAAIFPGDQLDLLSFNQFSAKLGGPKLSGPVTNNTKIQKINYKDPFFQGMFDKQPDKLNLPAFTKAYFVNNQQAAGFTSLISLQSGSPLFLKLGKPYNAYFFNSSLSESFGNFKSNALYSSILLRMAESSQRRYPIYLTLGSEAQFPLYKVPESEEALKLKSAQNEFIPESSFENNLFLIRVQKNSFQSNLKAGQFEIIKGKSLGFMSLNYDRQESDPEQWSADEIKAGFAEKGIKQVNYSTFTEQHKGDFIHLEKPIEYWRLLLVLALGFLLCEMALLKWMK